MIRLLVLPLLLLGACATTSPEPLTEPGQTQNIVWPTAPEPARIEFVTKFSNAEDLGHQKSFSQKIGSLLTGSDDRRMTRPYAIAVNANLIAVADPGSATVHLFDKKRKSYRQLLKAGKHHFVSPIGVALGDNRLYVADSDLNTIFVLDRRFRLVLTIEGFQRPTSLAFDPNHKRLYVADTLAHEIHVLSHDGERLFKFGKNGEHDGQFNYPSHIAFVEDRLFVNDTMNFRVQIFSPDGQHLSTFGEHGNGPGFLAQPKGISADSEGHVYVVDAFADHVQIFDQTGQFLLRFGQSGDGPGAFRIPSGLAIWNNKIYVADSYNHRVQVFQYLQEEH
jgi:DNA-binding beta-propeller fold protein YncE